MNDANIIARAKIDQCSLGEGELSLALDHLRAAAIHYQRGGREAFTKNITEIVQILAMEAIS